MCPGKFTFVNLQQRTAKVIFFQLIYQINSALIGKKMTNDRKRACPLWLRGWARTSDPLM
jgi:hypothetical protein